MTLDTLCWNIRAPRAERARRQAKWLSEQVADLVVLTECRASLSSTRLIEQFEAHGWQVVCEAPREREYGVILASRRPVELTPLSSSVGYLTPRVVSVKTEAGIEVVALYVPSRGFDRADRAARKRRFLDCVEKAIGMADARRRIVCGDLNVLEPDHTPRYRHVEDWECGFYSSLRGYGLVDAYRHLHPDAVEHSWVGRGGDGYRYDHVFVSSDLVSSIRACGYAHETRERGLSDHSAMVLRLA